MGRWPRRLFLPACVGILLAAALVVPFPYVVLSPGHATSLAELVDIADRDTTSLEGAFLLTTVNQAPGSLGRLVQGLVNDAAQIVPRGTVIPDDQRSADYYARQREIFAASADVAAAVGLAAAGIPVNATRLTGGGALIESVVPGSAAEGRLRPGDIIRRAGQRPVLVSADLVAALQTRPPGAPLRLLVERAGATTAVTVTPAAVPGVSSEPILGISFQQLPTRIRLPVDVRIDGGRVGGPSAGLMVALTVFDLLSPENLAGGRRIAGTGTIDLEGTVGRIGGIATKVAGAQAAGVDVFLVPAQQADAARAALEVGTTMQVVAVDTFDQALARLRRTPSR